MPITASSAGVLSAYCVHLLSGQSPRGAEIGGDPDSGIGIDILCGECYSSVVEKMDSACSRNMTGAAGRLQHLQETSRRFRVQGFNGSIETGHLEGINPDGKREILLETMPDNLALLCAQDYAQGGAVILFSDKGYVLRLEGQQLSLLRDYIEQLTIAYRLKVVNHTYEMVRDGPEDGLLIDDWDTGVKETSFMLEDVESYYCECDFCKDVEEHQHTLVEGTVRLDSHAASVFFNGGASYSTADDYIFALMLQGFSMEQLQKNIGGGIVSGVDGRFLTKENLVSFEKRHGRTPDVVQQSLTSRLHNRRGFEDVTDKASAPGRVQVDGMFSDYLELRVSDGGDTIAPRTTKKLVSLGGSICALVGVDEFSHAVFGKLAKSTCEPVSFLAHVFNTYGTHGHRLAQVSADSGIVAQKMFRILTGKSKSYLESKQVVSKQSEPRNHSNGTALVETEIRWIKRLMRMAYAWLESNWSMLKELGIEKQEIYKCWGEIFFWAVCIRNLYECPAVPGKSKYEVFTGVKPNMQRLRLLPIFSVLLFFDEESSIVDNHRQAVYSRGLYLGPHWTGFTTEATPGAIRVATMTSTGLKVRITSKYKAVSQGGQINIAPAIDRGLNQILDREISEEEDEVETSTPEPLHREPTEPGPEQSHEQELSPHDRTVSGRSVPTERPVAQPGQGEDNDNIFDTERHRQHGAQGGLEVKMVRSRAGRALIPSAKLRETMGAAATELEVQAVPEESTFRGVRVAARDDHQDYAATATFRYEPILSEHDSGKIMEAMVVEARDEADSTTAESTFRGGAAQRVQVPERTGAFFSWTTFRDDNIWKNPEEDCYYTIASTPDETYDYSIDREEGYKAVTENTPKGFQKALTDPLWGDAARSEWETLLHETIYVVPREIADEDIRERGSDLVYLFPVYEEKMREGKLVRKVRLVADGRGHSTAGKTYSVTPSREVYFQFLSKIAKKDWDYHVIDEKRAFLGADRQDKIPLYVAVRGAAERYRVKKALYGLKTSTHDHAAKATELLRILGYTETDSGSMYIRVNHGLEKDLPGLESETDIFRYVDDYIVAGFPSGVVDDSIKEFRRHASTTPPIPDAAEVLGMELVRDRVRRTISVTMVKKIEEAKATFFGDIEIAPSLIPFSRDQFIVGDSEFECDSHRYSGNGEFLSLSEIRTYLKLVGVLVWLIGYRHMDNLYVTYLTWFTKKPRVHHMNCALSTLRCMYTTRYIPLVLGGIEDPSEIIGVSDAALGIGPKLRSALGIGPKLRSIIGTCIRLGPREGAIRAKCKATDYASLSSFEAELNGYIEIFEQTTKVKIQLREIYYPVEAITRVMGDNEAALNYLAGNSAAEGTRFAELKTGFIRERVSRGDTIVQWVSGKIIVCDGLTKPSKTVNDYCVLRDDIMGLQLLAQGVRRTLLDGLLKGTRSRDE